MKKILSVILLFLMTSTTRADINFDFIEFHAGEDILADDYNFNYNMIVQELNLREYSIEEIEKKEGDRINYVEIQQDFNNILDLKGLNNLDLSTEAQVKFSTFNDLFNLMNTYINNEFKTRACEVNFSTSCLETWNENDLIYNRSLECNPNYQVTNNICEKYATFNFTLGSKESSTIKFTLKPYQSVSLTASGYIKAGNSGGYHAGPTTNYSDYGNNSSYNRISPCPHGGIMYHDTAWRCGSNAFEITNNSASDRNIYFGVNDKDRSNNSGSLTITVTYKD